MERRKKGGLAAAVMLAALLSISSAFAALAASAVKAEVPAQLHMDMNSRQTSIYDGYSAYVMGNRASADETFTVTTNRADLHLEDVTLNYYLITYNGDTQKYLECTVHGLKEGEHYPVVRPETVAREAETGQLYDYLERCYLVELAYQDMRSIYYFNILPESDMPEYRNILLGKWVQDSRGWRYLYQGSNLTAWACINEKWYFFDNEGYMRTGWQRYKGLWYYFDPDNGVMQTDREIDGYYVGADGIRQ